MNTEVINLDNAEQCQELIRVVNASESREPHVQRQFTPTDLRELVTDPTAFQAYGRLWRTDDGVVGFGYLRNFYVNEICVCDLKVFVHPAQWERDTADAILTWAFGEARALRRQQNRRVKLYSDCLPNAEWRKRVLEAHGLAPVRYFYHMERPMNLPLPHLAVPNPSTLRTFDHPRDLERWVAVFNAAYAGQWNYTPTTEAIQAELREDPRYQARYDVVLEGQNGQLAAFCLGFVLERDGKRAGWVLELGVAPHLRNQGLGRLLLWETLRRFGDSGLGVVRLAVDGANPSGAMRLYQSLGFTSISSEILYGHTLE